MRGDMDAIIPTEIDKTLLWEIRMELNLVHDRMNPRSFQEPL